MNTWNERWSTLKFRHTGHEHKRVSFVRYSRPWISIGRSWLELGSIRLTKGRQSLCLSSFNAFEMGSVAENPILIDEIQYKKNFLLQQIQSLKDGAFVLLKQKLGVFAITFKDIGVNTSSFEYDCKYDLKKMFQFITIFIRNESENCDTNTFILPLPTLFLVAANLCIYHVHTETKCTTP